MKKAFLLLIVYCFLFTAVLAQAPAAPETEYELLAPLPGVETSDGSGKATASSYIAGLFQLMVAVAGVLAVVMLVYGGIEYMSTEAFTGKSAAKDRITNAIWGLMLAIGAWLILFTIDPVNKSLVDFNLSLSPIVIRETPPAPGPGGGPHPSPAPGNCQDCVTIVAPVVVKTGACGDAPCTINRAMYDKLVRLKNDGQNFLVTEAFPNTVIHGDPCHATGTCIDATISSNTAQTIRAFLTAAENAGLNAKFEVTSNNRYVDLTRAGVPSQKIMVNTRATGEHFHIK